MQHHIPIDFLVSCDSRTDGVGAMNRVERAAQVVRIVREAHPLATGASSWLDDNRIAKPTGQHAWIDTRIERERFRMLNADAGETTREG